MNKKTVFFLVVFCITVLGIMIQSVVFPLFFKNDYMPDISLILLVYFSINYGKNTGQILGFSTGIILDSLSGVPFGLNTMVRLLIGFSLGLFQGKIFMDKIILPILVILLSTIYKFLLYFIISKIYPIDLNVNFFTIRYLIEIGLNIILTPLIFIFLSFLEKKLYPVRVRN